MLTETNEAHEAIPQPPETIISINRPLTWDIVRELGSIKVVMIASVQGEDGNPMMVVADYIYDKVRNSLTVGSSDMSYYSTEQFSDQKFKINFFPFEKKEGRIWTGEMQRYVGEDFRPIGWIE